MKNSRRNTAKAAALKEGPAPVSKYAAKRAAGRAAAVTDSPFASLAGLAAPEPVGAAE